MRLFLAIAVVFLAFLGVSASVLHYLREPYNEGFLRFPGIVGVHVVLGGAYLAFAPFQFVGRIRNRWPGLHRWSGRVLSSVGMLVGASAFFIAIVIPFSGWPERVVNGFFAAFFVYALAMGVANIRAGRVQAHREWMIRAFAIGLAIATMRLIFIPMMMVIGDDVRSQVETMSIVAFTAAFLLHWGVAEWWIRYTRAGLPDRRGEGLQLRPENL